MTSRSTMMHSFCGTLRPRPSNRNQNGMRRMSLALSPPPCQRSVLWKLISVTAWSMPAVWCLRGINVWWRCQWSMPGLRRSWPPCPFFGSLRKLDPTSWMRLAKMPSYLKFRACFLWLWIVSPNYCVCKLMDKHHETVNLEWNLLNTCLFDQSHQFTALRLPCSVVQFFVALAKRSFGKLPKMHLWSVTLTSLLKLMQRVLHLLMANLVP